MKKVVNFGIIGCGLMGREIASASMRWPHLLADIPAMKILGVCDMNEKSMDWFRQNQDTKYFYTDYHDLINNPEIDAIYCAVPNHLHGTIYSEIIRAGKALLGEKPFGIDQEAFNQIQAAMDENPDVFVRCSSEFPFYPAVQEMYRWYNEGRLGRIIEAKFAIKHSSDMDASKPINWKRTEKFNGRYGCMGDLGLHAQHLPFRLGFKALTVSAQLANLIKERPDGKGGMAPCETYDNAILSCETMDKNGDMFPMFLEMKRIAPGCNNTVEYEIYGLKTSVKFTSEDPNALWYCENTGRKQAWCRLPMGQATQYPVITGDIFEFGFSDSILQMLAAFVAEYVGAPCDFGCLRPEEAAMSHKMLTAALEAYENKCVKEL